jgi:hypothetical protein
MSIEADAQRIYAAVLSDAISRGELKLMALNGLYAMALSDGDKVTAEQLYRKILAQPEENRMAALSAPRPECSD